MSSKRKCDSSTLERAKKVPKLNKKQVDTSTVSTAKLKKLQFALDQNVCDSQVLQLIREIITTAALDQSLLMNILQYSIRTNNSDVAYQVLFYQNVDLKTKQGGETLWAAVGAGNAAIAKLLLQSNVDANVRNPEENTTLLHTVLKNEIENKEELFRMMVKCGADVNAVDNNGYSVLYQAISDKECSTDLVVELLKLGANLAIDKGSQDNYLFWASCYKPELLARLVQYQVPDENTRNERGLVALDYLISEKHVNQLRIMKEILDLGIPVNMTIPCEREYSREHPCPLLSAALWAKKKDVIALLVQYGADVHQKDEFGHTPLYQAMKFKGYTNISRLLLESGAKIDERDTNGRYPIHGACENDSLRNIHLLLNLGADINVTDNRGFTPFNSIRTFGDAGRLVIKHFALIVSKGGEINETDKKRVNLNAYIYQHYLKCTLELEKMKVTNICDGISYFALLSLGISSMMRLTKNSGFTKNFKQNHENLADLFPIYHYMLLHSFKIAKLQYKILSPYIKALHASLEKKIPVFIIHKIASYVKVNLQPDLKHCHDDFYMALHKSLKNNQTDKGKIL